MAEMLDGQIGYIKIANFDTRCAEETNAAMDELIAGAAKLIFDVRNNGSGYKGRLVKVLDKILPEGILFQTRGLSGLEANRPLGRGLHRPAHGRARQSG